MDRSERPPPRHRRNSPSFSSSLLDAIYRSIDESDSGGGNLTARAPNPTPKKTRVVSERPMTRPHYLSTSASSDSSSYFSSSSDADSARIVRPKPVRTAPVLPRSDPPPPPPNPKKNPISIKKKLRDLKKSTSPSSPGAKLAGFLNSLFTASNHKKPKISAPSPAEDPSSICSSASSYSRSCLSKTPSTSESAGGRRSARSVRFCPVGVIVGEDCRPCGEKVLFDGDMAAAERRKRMVEELLKGFEMEEDESGDESEDLFELENLAGIGGGGRLRDELPVYETTDLEMNCAIAKGLIV